jgi:hypothetical protein
MKGGAPMSPINWKRVAIIVAAVVVVSLAAPLLLYIGGVARLAATGQSFE